MNFNIESSYQSNSIKGPIMQPLQLCSTHHPMAHLQSHWPLNTFNFYIDLDLALTQKKQELQQQIIMLKKKKKEEFCLQKTQSLAQKLKKWYWITRKRQFYHINDSNRDINYDENGLLSIYQYGDMHSIFLFSEIEKYKSQNNEDQQSTTMNQLRKDEIQMMFKDISIKISKYFLIELKNQMYYASKALVNKLLQYFGIVYNYENSFAQNYNKILTQRKINRQKQTRQQLVIFFTMKLILSLNNLQNACYFISYLKNILLDRSNGILTVEYEIWVMIYEISLKLYAKNEVVREKQLIQIDQILSNSLHETEFQSFLIKNAEDQKITLSSINFYIKNSKKQQKDQLKPIILAKINGLFKLNFWKYTQDIFEYIQNDLSGLQKQEYLNKIITKIQQLIRQEETEVSKIFEIEYGITFILENIIKYINNFNQLFTEQLLHKMIELLQYNSISEAKALILFRLFNQFISLAYNEAQYQSWDLPSFNILIKLVSSFLSKNLLCNKSVFKFIFYQMTIQEKNDSQWNQFFQCLINHYFIGSYNENSDLELIHSHQNYKQLLSSVVLQKIQILMNTQIVERKNMRQYFNENSKSQQKNSYFMIKGFKDKILFQSIQSICLIFNSHLSMQTLEIGLQYCTPFMHLPSWENQETQYSLLSSICQQMPIQTLKFVYKEIGQSLAEDILILQKISPKLWSQYWNQDRRKCAAVFSSQKISLLEIESLHKLRKFQYVLNMCCCVFDKLNQNSQKNIKEIKIIYENGASKIMMILSKLKRLLFDAMIIRLVQQAQKLTLQEINSDLLTDQDSQSFFMTNYIKQNSFMATVLEFNVIGKINKSQMVQGVEKIILSPINDSSTFTKNCKQDQKQILSKIFQVIFSLEAPFINKLSQNIPQNREFQYLVQMNKQWVKNISYQLNALNVVLQKSQVKHENECLNALQSKANQHIKCIISKIILPQTLTIILTHQIKLNFYKSLQSLIKSSLQLINTIDNDYQQHFIILIQKLQEFFKDNKIHNNVQSTYILNLLQLFIELIFKKIRIRSYHLYRIIKYYQKLTSQNVEQFNHIISQYIRLLFQEFITNYKNISQIQQLCAPKKSITPVFQKFIKHQHSLNYIETSCTLSMFINLFCRLNYTSLAVGVEKIFSEQEPKAIYIDYLNSLTRKIMTQQIQISQKDLEILKIDVYGNLSIITKSKLSQRILNKVISLAKNLLRIKIDIKGVNKLPIKILAQKITFEQIQINLQQFQDQCKAISLGAISLNKKLSSIVSSNLHLCNIYYLSGKNLDKFVELNSNICGKNKSYLNSQINNLTKAGLSGLKISIDQQIVGIFENLMKKIEKFYSLCSKQTQYVQKLYSILKIIFINCLNIPQIIPIVLNQYLIINQKSITFLQFIFQTLKMCLPLFCQFYTMIIKTNSNFIKISQQAFISNNLKLQIIIKQKLLSILKHQIQTGNNEHVYLMKAINFVQDYTQNNRFRFYRFMKENNEFSQKCSKEFDRYFNQEIIYLCQRFIKKQNYSGFDCYEIYEILHVALDKYYLQNQTYNLDLKKLLNQEEIRKKYYSDEIQVQNKQNIFEDSQKTHRQIYSSSSSKTKPFKNVQPILLQIFKHQQPFTFQYKSVQKQRKMQQKYLQQQIISMNQSKFVLTQLQSIEKANSLNKIIIQKCKYFNEQLQNRQLFKQAFAFPTKTGLQIGRKMNIDINYDSICQQCQIKDSFVEKQQQIEGKNDCIVQSNSEEQIQFSNRDICSGDSIDEFIQVSHKAIQQERNIDRIYSQIQIQEGQDGSMKLFGQQESINIHNQGQEIRQQVTKNDIVRLIQDYTLNPEAIKQIIFKIKYLKTNELQLLQSHHSGQISYVIQAQLKSRGIASPLIQKNDKFDYYFMDQSKIYQRLRYSKRNQSKQILIPILSSKFTVEWLTFVMKLSSTQNNNDLQYKMFSSFCKYIMLHNDNVELLIKEAINIINLDSNEFSLKFDSKLTMTSTNSYTYYQQLIVDYVFSVLLQNRIGIPIIFNGYWSNKQKRITDHSQSQSCQTQPIIQILLQCIMNSKQKQSMFMKKLIQYTQVLNKVVKYQYPYYQLQDTVTFAPKIIDKMYQKMCIAHETFTSNKKYLDLFKIILYLSTNSYHQFLKITLNKSAEIIKKTYQKEENLFQFFKKTYGNQQSLHIERKAQIYWQLRKTKNVDQFNNQLVFCRKLLTQMSSIILDLLKQNCFNLYYKAEEIGLKEQNSYFKKKAMQVKNYIEKCQLQRQFKQKEKRYTCWRKNLINLLIVEEIVPTIETIGRQFVQEVKQTSNIINELYQFFSPIAKSTPALFKQAGQYYKFMLAFQLLKKQEEQTFHSMSLLKTLPSIQSTKQMIGKRRHSLCKRSSVLVPGTIDLAFIIRTNATIFTSDSLIMQVKDPLSIIHAKYADTQTKLKYLKVQNKLGQKTLEVTRQSMWADTYPYLDDNFGDYDIKIKISGQLGIDYGGVTRQWINTIVKQVMDPKLGLFQLNANHLAFQPSKFSYLVPNHLEIFQRFGILVGKAMKQNWLLQINFTKSFLKHLLGALLYVQDLQDLEPDTAQGLLWILKNHIQQQDLGLNFTYQQEIFEIKRCLQLVPGGSQVLVNENNKKQYVKKLAYNKMTQSIRQQSLAFMSGVQKVIPIEMLKLFNYKEISKFLAGQSTIQIHLMQKYAKYEGFNDTQTTIKWFWDIMNKMDEQNKGEFLFFLTGSYRVPYSGFKDNPITINKMANCKDYLPVAHTCFSIIDLPEYSCKQKMQRLLLKAIKQGKGFTVS